MRRGQIESLQERRAVELEQEAAEELGPTPEEMRMWRDWLAREHGQPRVGREIPTRRRKTPRGRSIDVNLTHRVDWKAVVVWVAALSFCLGFWWAAAWLVVQLAR